MQSRMIINDTTLRDGAQTPGVAFSTRDKLRIASILDEIGVEEIEAGIPVMGRDECSDIEAILSLNLNARVMVWCRAAKVDICAALSTGAPAVELSLPLSDMMIAGKLGKDRAWVLDQLKRSLELCAGRGIYISVGGEDASRADSDFVALFAETAYQHGASRFRYCDTVGMQDPFAVYASVTELRKSTRIDIEIHTHNDFGMATANALAAVRAGAVSVNTTIMGLGERAGNAPLEEVIMAAKHLYFLPVEYDTTRLTEAALLTAEAAGRKLDPARPVVGELMFTHESGIHGDGVLKNPKNYEAFPPEEVGRTRRLVAGTHTGGAVVAHILHRMGFQIAKDDLPLLVAEVRRAALSLKRALNDEEVALLYQGRKIG